MGSHVCVHEARLYPNLFSLDRILKTRTNFHLDNNVNVLEGDMLTIRGFPIHCDFVFCIAKSQNICNVFFLPCRRHVLITCRLKEHLSMDLSPYKLWKQRKTIAFQPGKCVLLWIIKITKTKMR